MNPPAWIAEKFFDYLNVSESPGNSDCIFVLAGREERKLYGIDLWRHGYAHELILSVGRFEWRRFYALDLDDGGLKKLVEATAPPKRHFFVRIRAAGSECSLVPNGRFGTLSEAEGLARQLSHEPMGALTIVSTSIHMRRVALVFRSAFCRNGVRLRFVAVPEEMSSLRRQDLRQDSSARSQVFREFVKCLVYRILLSLRL